MLEIKIPEAELFDERTSKLIRLPEVVLHLEHSLRSLSKWETRWGVPFLSNTKKTREQLVSYVSLMSETPIEEATLDRFGPEEYQALNDYLNAKHSATWFSEEPKTSTANKTVTSELIYYWMTAFNIPFECDTWPLARLMNLINIAQIKNDTDPKKRNRPKSQMLSERAALNAKRKAELNTRG